MLAIRKHSETLGFLYALSIVIVSFVFTSEKVLLSSSSFSSAPSSSSSSSSSQTSSFNFYASPLVGRRNASSVIKTQVNRLKVQFEMMLSDPSYTWKVLRNEPNQNLTISVHYMDLKDEDGYRYQQPYIKSSIYIEAEPKAVSKLFTWRHLHDAFSVIDPLYESSDLISKVSLNTNLIRMTTKPLIMFPKREFFLAHSHLDQRKPVHISEYHKIPSGSLIISFVNVRLNQDDYREHRNSTKYVKASQDYIAWFSKVEFRDNHVHNNDGTNANDENDRDYKDDRYYPIEGTMVTTISRVDLGLPRWLLKNTIGVNTVASSMVSLKNIAEN